MKLQLDRLWLKLPLGSVNISPEFKKHALANGYTTMGQVLAIRLTTLIKMDLFTPSMFEELAWAVKPKPQ
jgi:hypothetical protein